MTQPEKSNQYGLVQKAIKHLQRLLMQSQKQKERQESTTNLQQSCQVASSTTSSSATLTAKSSPNKDSGSGTGPGSGSDFLPINEDTKLNIKDELDLQDLDDKLLNDFNLEGEKIGNDIKLEIEDIEMDELSSSVTNTQNQSDSEKENEVHIDPKTYCKLGHFHLLLEEFDKGF